MFSFGSIVLTRFPFTDLTGDKRRPALVVSRNYSNSDDIVVCFITSVQRICAGAVPIEAGLQTGLKVPSIVRFDKIATVNRRVVSGLLGTATLTWLEEHHTEFHSVFGFADPTENLALAP